MADTYPEEPIQHDPLAPPHPEEHPERHEHSDVSIRALTIFFIAFVAVAVIVHVGLWVLFEVYEAREAEADVARRQSALVAEPVDPPTWDPNDIERSLSVPPPLQGIPDYHENTPAQDTVEMRLAEEKQLNRFELNPDGSARVPIDRAMELLVERDLLPVRQPQEQPQQQEQQQLQQQTQRNPSQEGGQDIHATSR